MAFLGTLKVRPEGHARPDVVSDGSGGGVLNPESAMTQRILPALAVSLVLAGLARAQSDEKPAAATAPEGAAVYDSTQQPDTSSTPPAAALPSSSPMPHETPNIVPPGACAADAGCDDRFWFSAEALLWWVKGESLPALVSTSPAGTPEASAGVLGSGTGTLLYGGNSVSDGMREGSRFNVGYWIDAQHRFALTAGFFFLTDKQSAFGASSSGNPILARPFLDASTGGQAALLVAYPGVVTGAIDVTTSSRDILGFDVGGEQVLYGPRDVRYVALFGWRYFQTDESLEVDQNVTATGATNPYGVAAGTNVVIADLFKTRNDFNGGNFGLKMEWTRENFEFSLITKLAVGYMHETADLLGVTQTTAPGGTPVVATSGLLVLPTNVGHYTQDEVALIPEFGLNLTYNVNDSWRVFGGYTFLYVSRLLRAPDQVDYSVNSTQLPPTSALSGAARPAFTFNETDLWMQGINLGVEFRY